MAAPHIFHVPTAAKPVGRGIEAAHESLRRVTGGPLRPGGLELTRRALDLLGLARGSRVLDAGCGFGASLALLDRLGMKALGVDQSAAKVLGARRAAPDALLARAGAHSLPLAPACLDAVLCECVLSLLPDPGAGLREFHGVLKPGGGLALTDVYATRDGTAPLPGSACCLDRAMTRTAIVELLARSGFTVQRFEDHTPLLTRLAGELILAGARLDDFRQALGPSACAAGAPAGTPPPKPGYYLLVARKQGNQSK